MKTLEEIKKELTHLACTGQVTAMQDLLESTISQTKQELIEEIIKRVLEYKDTLGHKWPDGLETRPKSNKLDLNNKIHKEGFDAGYKAGYKMALKECVKVNDCGYCKMEFINAIKKH